MPVVVPARRLLVAASLVLLTACRGDPISSLAPSDAPRRAIDPGSITVADLGAPSGEAEVSPQTSSDAGDILATGSSTPIYLYRNGAWSEVTGFDVPVSPRAINDAGDIVVADATRGDVEFLRRADVTTVLPLLAEGDYAFANAMNNAGVVVGGYTHGETGVTDAVIWRPGAAEPEFLPPLPGGDGSPGTRVSVALGINDAGLVVGNSFVDGFRAVLWENGVPRDLGTLGGSGASAQDINARGEIVGMSYTSTEQAHPFLWRNGTMTDLDTFGEGATFVVAINDAGQVIANGGIVESRSLRGVVWDDGVLTPLEPLPGYARSNVIGITNDGRVIGRSYEPLEPGMTPSRASVWTLPLPPGEGEPPHGAPHGSPHDPHEVSPHAPPPVHAAAASTHHR